MNIDEQIIVQIRKHGKWIPFKIGCFKHSTPETTWSPEFIRITKDEELASSAEDQNWHAFDVETPDPEKIKSLVSRILETPVI